MKSSDLKVATHADIANIRYCFFCQPGGVPHTLTVRTNWLKVPVRYRPNAASGGWSYGRDLVSAVKRARETPALTPSY